MSRSRRSLLLAVAILAAGLGAFVAARPAHDAAGWRRDYDTLRAAMEARYANLTGLAARVDLPALHARTDAALRGARTDREAQRALLAFVQAFGDGHLVRVPRETPRAVRWLEERWTARGGAPRPAWSAARACDAFGYAERDGDFSVAPDAMGAVAPVAREGSFHAALVTLPSGARLGVVRIRLFSPQAYRAECEAAWPAIQASLAPDCDDCEARLRRETEDRLLATLGSRIRALRAAGATALLVDLGGNGGGSEWAEDVARVLTDLPVRSARASLVRGPATAAMLAGSVAELDSARAAFRGPPRAGLALDSARATYAALQAAALKPCDVSAVWRSGDAACSNLLPATTYTSGVYDYLAPGALGDAVVERLLYLPARSARHAGAWHGPVLLLVDGRTASASEEVVSALRDSRAATVVGARTLGAGCGYVGDVPPVVLPHSGLKVRMPNCVRLRADGTNEVLGVQPDVVVPWEKGDDQAARGRKLAAALAGLVPAP